MHGVLFRMDVLNFPIGVDDYKNLIEDGYVYVDKTLLIKEFWENKSKVLLVTRPRRFGKSISLSMLRCFFEKTDKPTAYLFENADIWKEPGFQELQGTFPVIHLSFKDIKATSWAQAYRELEEVLQEEMDRIITPIAHFLSPLQKQQYDKFITKTADSTEWSGCLKSATKILEQHYQKKTIILIDEYDSPITNAYLYHFYEEMTDFMRQLLSKALKGNVHLCRGFMTGVVRTAKDGILSGLNNPKICTMLDKNFSDKFGFTQSEVEILLFKAGRLTQKEEVKNWYNGYVIGAEYLQDPTTAHLSASVYNPWSILSYLEGSVVPKTYWANTGTTKLLENLIAEAKTETQEELLLLLEKKHLKGKQINQDVILLDLDKKHPDPWSFLFFAGYLTTTEHSFQNDRQYYTLAIPNKEIMLLYQDLVLHAIEKTFTSKKLKSLLQALTAGDVFLFSSFLEEFICSMCSAHDLPHNDLERSLHMFILGLLASLSERFTIKSNLESGHGRYDILLHPKNTIDLAIAIELKKGQSSSELELLSSQALEQIKEKKYTSLTKDFGYTGKVLCYGIAAFKKHVAVKAEVI